MNLNRVNSVLVTNTGGANTGTTLQNIIDGDVLIFNSLNVNLTGTPTPTSAVGNQAIYIAQGLPLVDSKNQFRASSRIKAKNITSWEKKAFAAPVQQVMHFGFNGVDGKNGINGIDGLSGLAGLNGKNGLNGVNGTQIFVDDGAPENDLGIIGDLFLNQETFELYRHTLNGWAILGTLKPDSEIFNEPQGSGRRACFQSN